MWGEAGRATGHLVNWEVWPSGRRAWTGMTGFRLRTLPASPFRLGALGRVCGEEKRRGLPFVSRWFQHIQP